MASLGRRRKGQNLYNPVIFKKKKNVSIKDEEQTEYRFWNQRSLKSFQVDRAPWATSARDGVSLALRALPRPRHFP